MSYKKIESNKENQDHILKREQYAISLRKKKT